MVRMAKRFSSIFLALGVTAALAFGAQTALAGASVPCTETLPPHSCASQPDPDQFCRDLCREHNWEGGECSHPLQDCCACYI